MKIKKTNDILFLLVIIVFLCKIIFYMAIKNQLITINFGGGNDADYYDDYALGRTDVLTTLWPFLLRELNEMGLYSRGVISIIILVISFSVIPYFSYKLTKITSNWNKGGVFVFFIIGVYPTLFYFTFDIYRDVVMLALLLISFSFLLRLQNRTGLRFVFLLFILIACIGLLSAFRGYLGASFLLTTIFAINKKNYFVKKIKSIGVVAFLWVIALYSAFYLGALDDLLSYRELFLDVAAGTNIGIIFDSPASIVPKFLLSAAIQLSGFSPGNMVSIFIFFIEGLPFLLASFYVIKNINYCDDFSWALIIFIISYNTIWILGNDNVGTAIRLRMLAYVPMFIVFMRTYQLKAQSRCEVR